MRVDRLVLPIAEIVLIGPVDGAGRAGELTVATADQRPQQVLMRRVVAARKRLVLRELGLHLIELRWGNEGWHHPDGNPALRRLGSGGAMRPTERMRRG